MRKIFVTGIGTEVGKTVVSAILTEALKADYWKPVQAGQLDNTDTMKVQQLVSNQVSKFHPESYCLSQFMSPHAGAVIDNIEIDLSKIQLPNTKNTLIIEGAGGLMVPLNDNQLVIDLIKHLEPEVVLVSQNYLGSINHTILSVEALLSRKIDVLGIIFNGKPNKPTEDFILNHTGLKCLGRIMEEREINKEVVFKYAQEFKDLLK
ncbi:MAG: dethiobiotin synthase [Bacteroidota bacterium]